MGVNVPAEPDLCAARLDAPARPERLALVERRPGTNVLTRQCANRRYDAALIAVSIGRAQRHIPALILFLELDVPGLPPIQLRAQLDATLVEPLLVSQRCKVVRVRELLMYALDGRVAQVVVVIVAYDYEIYGG
jgi:hypothetical protein